MIHYGWHLSNGLDTTTSICGPPADGTAGSAVYVCASSGEYELVADLQYWQQNLSVEGFLRQVTQRYAYHTVVKETARVGFQVAEQQKNEDGSIRLLVQRWSA